MEPPTKRLRILQSVAVDETNPDYINAKQQQKQKFKDRLESIFAKYENMHESMSDEIDMDENKIVVDRGHLRRLARQVDRNETVLLDNLGLGNAPEPGDQEEEEEKGGDSEDELAPTQPSKSSSGRIETKRQHGTAAPKVAYSSPMINSHVETQATHSPQPIPNTPNPAANLLQLVQFPQTPAGQQAQTSFYATLAQTINQAVQQAVAPLISNILTNTPNVQLPFANPLTVPTTPITNSDKIAPATDPKWFFPPLAPKPQNPEAARSSPVPNSAHISPVQKEVTQGLEAAHLQEDQELRLIEGHDCSQQTTISVAAIMQSEERANSKPVKAIRRTSPRVEIQRKHMHRTPKYHFTEEDDIYIIQQKMIPGRTWAAIKDSKEKWRCWPIHPLQHRWSQRLKRKDLHLKDTAMQVTHDNRRFSEDPVTAYPPHHLPTPSSLGHDDSHEQADHPPIEHMEKIASSSAHFDDDERDLLSLAGTDIEEDELPVGNEEESTFFPDTDEIILPSVELTEFVDEDTLQQGLLEESFMDEVTTPVTETIARIKVEPQLSSPTNRRKAKQAFIAYQAIPDLETEVDDADHVGFNASPQQTGPFVCDICNATFANDKKLERHQANPRSMHDKLRSKSASIDLVGEDELQAAAPSTPYIKREFSTPPPTSFIFSTPAAQSHSRVDLRSSGGKPISGLSRKAYLKQVKQSWTRKSTPVPKTVNKRTSFHTVPKKRAWVGDADSDDELGF